MLRSSLDLQKHIVQKSARRINLAKQNVYSLYCGENFFHYVRILGFGEFFSLAITGTH